jgi:hypothetical protein
MRTSILAFLVALGFAWNLRAEDVPLAVAQLDVHFTAAWSKAGIRPAPPADDAAYLRRAYLDITGTLPPPATIRAFLLDPSADKRGKVVDQLLAGPEYATRWANY